MKYNFQNSLLAAAFLALTAFVTSCGKDDEHHNPGTEQELITTLRLNFAHLSDSTKNTSITFIDPDGDGGQNGIFTPDTLRLSANAQYNLSIEVLDESNPAQPVNLSEEIKQESADHQFFFVHSQNLNLFISNLDRDTNNLPLGLKADATTGAASRGSVRVSLYHYGEVAKDGITPSAETDIEIDFPVSVE